MLDRALPPALLSLVLVISRASAAPYNFLDNYRDPAPSPEDGPPASYHATRDRNRLAYDVGGLVGGYVLTVLIWGVLLLTVGRRMRRKALDPPKQLELELQDKPTQLAIKTGPLSPPLSARSWLKKFKKNDSAVGSPQSPVVQSPGSFDQKVLDAHKDQAQADMERLYAAVMDHDERKHFSKVSVEEAEMIGQERRRPSAISVARSHDDSPISPVKAIYPPGYHNSPMTAPLPRDRLHEQQPPASPRSVLSKRSQASQMSVATNNTSSKNARFNLKNLRISGPVQKYPGADSDDEARTPLSPHFSNHPNAAPPSPPTQQNSPTTPYDPSEELDQVQPLPRPAPQRLLTPSSLQSQPQQNQPQQSSPSSSLPLRSFAEPLKSPGIQTTVLDRARMDKLSLTTPKTGVPFTPYSPYMPFTPITPVTPHLVSKRDRKMMARVEGRRRAALKEDLVQSPKEIFGDAY
ncbi:Nn.00g047930.m01.CDS01 [Neocucurbitaria sp. VM-36]